MPALALLIKKELAPPIAPIEGDGQVYLGKVSFSVGSNGLSTTFSGVLHPGRRAGSVTGPAR